MTRLAFTLDKMNSFVYTNQCSFVCHKGEVLNKSRKRRTFAGAERTPRLRGLSQQPFSASQTPFVHVGLFVSFSPTFREASAPRKKYSADTKSMPRETALMP